ncbi:hypothetical protein [Phytohabitans aurantiacus]|uniref:MucB/RseB N-terminal domain-containing protein n=1 Tax=Phytohabitans aurantiacus TaxID=3016789 RepID=A0ABQ5R728_9ACTN|nr:hypothetical protein [Phytohabitans aurantiacus]GLI02566.1 hypothetical protein Pa4123_78440 [Phytohabitans aurantiacus]
MDEIEDLVRSTLVRRSDEVTPDADLADRVRRRSRRARRRTQSVVAAAMAAAAVLLAAPALAGFLRPSADPEPAAESAAEPAPVTEAFPFVPRVAPNGYGAPVAEIEAGHPVLRQVSADGRWLAVSVTPSPPAGPDEPAKSYLECEVRGHAGTLAIGATTVLTWKESDGRWVRVEADSRVEVTVVTAYAEGLDATGSVPVLVPFKFDATPPGLVLDTVTPAVMTFRPPDVPASADFVDKLVVSLSPVDQMPKAGQPATAGRRPARIIISGTATTVYADLGDGRMLEIQAAARTGLDPLWLTTFAAGVYPTADATVSKG